MSASFLRAYVHVKANGLVSNLIASLASIDPAGVSAADIDDKIAKLDGLGVNVQELERKHADAKQALDRAERLNAQRLHALETMQTEHDGVDTPSPRKASLEPSINNMLETIEQAQGELIELRQVEQETQQDFTELNKLWDEKVQGLRNRKSELAAAQRELGRAQRANGRAHDRAATAEVTAGLKETSGNAVDNAVAAMRAKTNRLADEAEALNRRTSALQPVDHERGDPNITAAMAQAGGATSSSTMSTADRIARLKEAAAKRAA